MTLQELQPLIIAKSPIFSSFTSTYLYLIPSTSTWFEQSIGCLVTFNWRWCAVDIDSDKVNNIDKMLGKALSRVISKVPHARFSSHLIKTQDLNPDPNPAKEGSKHYNKDYYSTSLDFDSENEQFIEFH